MGNYCVSSLALLVIVPALFIGTAAVAATENSDLQHLRLARFFKTLDQGGRVKVAFFGGSITWGATATDPMKTSYRALVSKYLADTYPSAHVEPIDAAIGGQPSKLGVFRVDRDVISYKPDVVFVEFAVNDGGSADAQETMEGIVRKLHNALPDTEVVIIIIGAGWDKYTCPSHDPHKQLADYYGLPCADVFAGVTERIAKGANTKDILFDGCHASDYGYRMYADIIIDALKTQVALKGPAKPYPEKPLTQNRYETCAMLELSKLPDLGGWKPAIPSVVGSWYDQQPSRWQSSAVAPSKDGATISADIECSGIGLYYEITKGGQPSKLMADGALVLDIDGNNPCEDERVMHQFKMFGETKKRHIELVAPKAEKMKASYFMFTK